jgi:hypothetical protein
VPLRSGNIKVDQILSGRARGSIFKIEEAPSEIRMKFWKDSRNQKGPKKKVECKLRTGAFGEIGDK